MTAVRDSVVRALRGAGARFAFVWGSRVRGTARRESDLDVAAWWGAKPPAAWDVLLPPGVDLLVLDSAPIELAGRVALDGEILFDDDPPARVRWQANTRKIFLDEEERQRRIDRIYLESLRGG
jgi:predicted nucleotidyltransferase